MTSGITNQDIMGVLKTVMDPELNKDLVTLNMIQDVEISGSSVSFTVVLTTPACPLKSSIEKSAREAVLAIQGVESVQINMSAKVPDDGRRSLLHLPIKNAVAIASGKGGVGKSTISTNISVALAQSGATVGLLDADIYGPNIPTMMGIHDIPGIKENKILPAEAYGVKIMSMGFLVKSGQPLIWRGPMLNSAIRQFLEDVEWGELDYLVIDLPPGTGDASLSLSQSLPLSGVVIVTLPQSVSLEDAGRGLEMFRTLEIPILGVVENMRGSIFGAGGGEDLARIANCPFLGAIPMEQAVRIGGDTGEPAVISRPKTASAKALLSISKRIAGQLSVMAITNTPNKT